MMMRRSVLAGLAVLALVEISAAARCRFVNGNYKLEWLVDSKDVVQFLLTYKNYPTGQNGWTGVAFGEGMAYGLDAMIVRVLNGQITLSDESVRGYGPSIADASQDSSMKAAKLDNGTLKVRFSRPIRTSDEYADASLEGCTTWQFIITINPAFGQHVGKHTQTPVAQRVCLSECRGN